MDKSDIYSVYLSSLTKNNSVSNQNLFTGKQFSSAIKSQNVWYSDLNIDTLLCIIDVAMR